MPFNLSISHLSDCHAAVHTPCTTLVNMGLGHQIPQCVCLRRNSWNEGKPMVTSRTECSEVKGGIFTWGKLIMNNFQDWVRDR